MLKRIFFLFLFLMAPVFAKDTYVSLRGYLGGDLMDGAEQALEDGERIIIQVSSSSGDIREVLSLAHQIDDLKRKEGRHVIVYIQGMAVGPAAVFPFLADEIITTPLVAWGDIPYGVGGAMTPEQIASSVRPLIKRNLARGQTLEKLVDAMVDPHYQLVYQNGQGSIEEEKTTQFDPLVLNLRGMESLGLVDKVLTDEAFATDYLPEKSQVPYVAHEESRGDLDQQLKKYIPYSETGENTIGYLHIGNDRSIDQSTYIYVKFALKDFVEKGVRFVVLELDTPGGEVLSALKIVDLLQKLDLQHRIPVVAFVNDWAISAGAMLAYSCRFIGVLKSSIMGAAEPVIMGQQGKMETASEKVNSALRAEFGTLASFYGRNPLIAEAMVDKDIILVLRDHQVVQLQEMNEVRKEGSHPDILITGKGKLLTLNGQEMMNLGVADFIVPLASTVPITEAEEAEGAWPASKSLLFQEPYFEKIPHGVMVEYRDWRVGFFSILTHPMVASLLFIGLVIGFYIEINSPGFGVPGSIALACLGLILLSSFASHAVNWIEIIILCVGLLFLALELFVIPGFGITGILGIVLTIIGLFALMLPGIGNLSFFHPETFRLVGVSFMERLAWLCGGLLFAIVVIILMARFFSHRYFRFSKLILKGEQEGYVAGIPRGEMPEVGDLGESVSPLRPSGKVHIGESLFDAVTQGGYLETHTPVEVVKVEGSKVIVKKVEGRDFS